MGWRLPGKVCSHALTEAPWCLDGCWQLGLAPSYGRLWKEMFTLASSTAIQPSVASYRPTHPFLHVEALPYLYTPHPPHPTHLPLFQYTTSEEAKRYRNGDKRGSKRRARHWRSTAAYGDAATRRRAAARGGAPWQAAYVYLLWHLRASA